MKKQTKSLMVLAGVLAVLLIIWAASPLWLNREPDETTITTREEIDPIFQSEAEDIARVEISHEQDTFALLPDAVTDSDGKISYDWQVEGMEDYPFAQTDLSAVANMAKSVYTSTEIESAASDLAPYGLDDPQATFSVVLKNGSRHDIKVGSLMPNKSYYYAMLDDSGRVCSLAKATGDRMMQTRLDLLDGDQVVSVEESDLTGFIFERARDAARIAVDCQLVGEPGTPESYIEYELREPIIRPGGSGNLNMLITETLAMTAADFVEIDPVDLAPYGLSSPQYLLNLQTAAGETEIKIGSQADSNHFYAISSEIPAVFKLPTSTFTSIDMKVIDMLDRFVALVSIWKVDRIDGNIFGETFSTEISMTQENRTTDEDVVLTLDGQDAKIVDEKGKSLYTKFYQRLISVMIAGLEPEAEPDNTKDASMVFHMKADPETGRAAYTQTVEFAPRDDYTYYVFIDGEYSGFYVEKEASFESTRKEYEGITVALDMMRYAISHAEDGVFNTEEGYPLN